MVLMALVYGGAIMAYYLKKTKIKGRTYLSIDESFYSNEKKGTAHRVYKSLSSVETLITKGIEDPIAYYQAEVDKLNEKSKEAGVKKISSVSPDLHVGYFPLKSIMEKMKIKKYVDFFKLANDFDYDLYDLLAALVYARSVNPCSKRKTFHEVIPSLYETYDFSYDQLLSGLSFLGSNYEKFIEIFTVQTKNTYKIDPSKTYFDCTNFYFEIDREDDFRMKGPSKENKKEPIVGLGLLLDANQIPIGMKMFPGNESEKPILRDVIRHLKRQNNVEGRTIHVADKGLNCAENIAFSKKNGDGYLFSKSVKSLPETEKVWVLLDEGFKEVRDKSGKLIYKYKSCVDTFPYTVTIDGGKKTVKLTEKRLLTYNPDLAAKKRYEINRLVEKAKSMALSRAKKNEFGEAGKYINYTDKDGKKACVSINDDAIEKDLKYAGYNLLVTSEINMEDKDIYDVYHNLWRIEESFKIMKSDLDARPVYLQKEDTIKGHFLICYIAVLLERLLQFKVLENRYSTSEIYDFIRKFQVVKAENKYINITASTNFIEELSRETKLPLTNYFLSETQLKSILKYQI